jgi:catechol-2,3-dioxygenase
MFPELEVIDHVHLYVSDRAAAEKWYSEFMGFNRMQQFESWIENGPLTIASGKVHLALFESTQPQKTTVAFGVNCDNFIHWIKHLNSKSVDFELVDHDLSWSIYFCDPDGNPFEITCYEYSHLSPLLRAET